MTAAANTAAGSITATSVILGGSHYAVDLDLISQKQSPAAPPKSPLLPSPPPAASPPTTARTIVFDKTLATAANLSKLLPTGTFLIFQALSPSFSNKGRCFTSNQCLTYALLLICVLSCVFFTFTDSLTGRDGRVYYGLATSEGFYVLNFDGGEEKKGEIFRAEDLRRRRRRWLDWVHAVFGVLVFLALAFSDADVQSCFFPKARADAKELLVNLPLGVGVLASLVFMVFPTTRKGIGYSDEDGHSK